MAMDKSSRRRTAPSGPSLFDALEDVEVSTRSGETDYVTDGDGLPAERIKPHTQQKYEIVRFYVEICGSVRRRWVEEYGCATTYIDLYSGPGRAYERATGNFCDTSPLIALASSKVKTGDPGFTHMFLADADGALVDAAAERLKRQGANVMREHGRAEQTVDKLIPALPRGLHFALLDPYSLNAIPFEVIRKLADVEHLDMLIHFSELDLRLNMKFNVEGKQDHLDAVVPNWRKVYDDGRSKEWNRAAILKSWCDSIGALGKQVRGAKGVTARGNVMYHLVLFSGHRLAAQFWSEMERRWPQQQPLGL